jgi:TonB family protein
LGRGGPAADLAVDYSQGLDHHLAVDYQREDSRAMKGAVAALLLICSGLVSAQDLPLRITPETAASNLLTRIDPIYPALSRAARVEATITMDVTIDKEGKVSDSKVTNGHPLLNIAALETVKEWRYKPYLVNGQPVDVIASTGINFSLPSGTFPVREGEIGGRIRHVDGGPAVNMPVAAVMLTDAGARSATFVARALTDQLGAYRLSSIPAGRYHIEAGAIAPTYFPGVTTLREAAAVTKATDLAAVGGIDFIMSAPVKVSGRITGEISAAALAAVRVGLSSYSGELVSAHDTRNRQKVPLLTSAAGRFEFTDVLPGSYGLFLRTETLFAHMSGGGEIIEVGSSDIGDRTLRSPGAFFVQIKGGARLARPVAGRITVLDQAGRPSDVWTIPVAAILLGATSANGAELTTSTQRDGTFALRFTEGRWLVYLPGLADRGYSVESISYGPTNLLKETLELAGTATGEIRVTLRKR